MFGMYTLECMLPSYVSIPNISPDQLSNVSPAFGLTFFPPKRGTAKSHGLLPQHSRNLGSIHLPKRWQSMVGSPQLEPKGSWFRSYRDLTHEPVGQRNGTEKDAAHGTEIPKGKPI